MSPPSVPSNLPADLPEFHRAPTLPSACPNDMPSSGPLLRLLSSLCFSKLDYHGVGNMRMQRAHVTALGGWDSPPLPWPSAMKHLQLTQFMQYQWLCQFSATKLPCSSTYHCQQDQKYSSHLIKMTRNSQLVSQI